MSSVTLWKEGKTLLSLERPSNCSYILKLLQVTQNVFHLCDEEKNDGKAWTVVIAADAVSPALWFYIILSRKGKGQSMTRNLRDHGCHIPLWLRGDPCEPGSGLMVASHSDPASS